MNAIANRANYYARVAQNAADQIAGFGEAIQSTIAVGSAVSLTTGTSATVTSISLPAGEWDINGQVDYRAGATTSITILTQGISTTAATLGAQDTFSRSVSAAFVPTASNDVGLPIRGQLLTLTATTTIYLVANATFTLSTLSAYGTIQARRIK
jgi:hypothetical protein